MQVGLDALKSEIRAAFDDVPVPDGDDILAARSRRSIDAGELQALLRGRTWASLPIKELFQHREMLSSLGALGFRAYIAAYLIASLLDGPYAPDLLEYTLFSLHPHGKDDREDTLERHSQLDAPQRAAIAAYLQYVSSRSRVAESIAQYWATTSSGVSSRER